MCKKLIYLVCFVLVLGVINSASAELVAHWKFDEGSGETAFDSSGNDYHATLFNNPVWVPGKIGSFALNQEAGGYGGIQGLFYQGSGFPEVSVCAWIRTSSSGDQYIVSFDRNEYYRLSIATTDSVGAGLVGWHLQASGILDYSSQRRVDDGQWHHVGGVYDNGTATIYIDGEPEPSTTQGTTWGSGNLRYGFIGKNSEANAFNSPSPGGNPVDGDVDDVRIYHSALTQAEVQQVMKGVPPIMATNPNPADKQTDVPREVVLSWTPGVYAPPTNGHTVYFSENFSDVNDGVGGIAQDANSYAPPQRLDFGTTYYWRVDEVNGPPDFTVYQGDVWSFTTEPFAYAIENITATASSSAVAKGPENTINGSGLDDSGLLHGKDAENNVWLSGMAGPQPTWIEYEFDRVYKLHEMWVWNSNETMEPVIGLGFKDVSIEYSVDGIDYTTLGTTHEFARAPGTPDYAHNTTVDTGGVPAKYVRLTANSNWGGLLPQYGLSEVRFFYIPAHAREPRPDSGATDVDVDVTLGWRAGREAAKHDAYVSTDEQAVIDSTADVTTVTEARHGPLSLDLGKTYYWKINEVNMAEAPTTWDGDVWNFATHEFLVVDDFESYNDLDPTDPESNRIFLTWMDGYGVVTNGSLVGYDVPPFCEQTIVHSGEQSMPFFFNNTGGAAFSEAELTLSPAQDWTAGSAKTLSLRFSGDPNNAPGQMYVKVNGSKVTYDGDASDLTLIGWQAWNIDLASVGTNLQNVTKLAIGVDGNGAAGKLLFDDIRLYPYERQFVTPVEPDPANLVGHWQLDGNFDDSSGNNRHGIAVGEPTFALGKVGQAINLDGVDDYVNITGYKGIAADRTDPNNPLQQAFSVACWINTTSDGSLVCWGSSDDTGVGGQYQNFRVDGGRLRAEHGNGRFRGAALVNDGQWHHVAMVVAEGANMEPPGTQLYVDGQKDTQGADTVNAQNIWNVTADADVGIGVRASHVDRFFNGMLDDGRIYDRVLTQEEIAWLAGRTQPFDKPF